MRVSFFTGELDIAYLFMTAPPVQMPFEHFSYWFGARYGATSLSLILILPLLKRFTSISDKAVCVLGLISKVSALVMLGLSYNTLMVYLGEFEPTGSTEIKGCVIDLELRFLSQIFPWEP